MTENLPATKPAPAKVPMDPKTGALMPQDLDGLYRLASVLASSGLMPKGIDTVADVFVCIQMGLEVGLSPMQAVQNISPINGRPAIWGDSQLALVRASGKLEEFDETFEGDEGQDAFKAVCKAKRKGDPTQYRHEFSVRDAKAAGLLPGKELSAWKKYPKRMLQMRARSWVLRDGFGDVLKGLAQAEEAMDFVGDLKPQQDGTYATQPSIEPAQLDQDGLPPAGPPNVLMDPAPETVETLPSFREMVDKKIVEMGLDHTGQKGALDLFEAFMEVTAEANDIDLAGVALEAAKSFDAFWGSFTRWSSQVNIYAQACQRDEAEPPQEPGASGAYEEETTHEIWDRANWINLRESGLPTFVFKNKKELQLAPANILAELQEKWERVCAEAPFPLTMAPAAPPETGEPTKPPQEVHRGQGGQTTAPQEPPANISQDWTEEMFKSLRVMQGDPDLLKLAKAQAKIPVISTPEDLGKVEIEFNQIKGLV